MRFEARKVIAARPDVNASAADVLAEPVVVCRASGTCVTPKDKKRK
jgi:3-aminobutyryl-CoA ammonia-lyase